MLIDCWFWRPILVHVAFQVDPLAQPGTVTLYLGANRGRGQTNHVVVSRSMWPRSSICRMLPQSREPSERRRHVVYISVILSSVFGEACWSLYRGHKALNRGVRYRWRSGVFLQWLGRFPSLTRDRVSLAAISVTFGDGLYLWNVFGAS